jgi:uncharacterized membrane protein YfbV (UPF0208 family)
MTNLVKVALVGPMTIGSIDYEPGAIVELEPDVAKWYTETVLQHRKDLIQEIEAQPGYEIAVKVIEDDAKRNRKRSK